MHFDKDKLKQFFFLLVLCGLGAFLFTLLKGYLSAFLGALVFYILLRQPYFHLTMGPKRKWNKTLTLFLLIFASFLVLVLPILLVSLMLSGKVGYIIGHYADILKVSESLSAKAKDTYGIDLLTGDTVNKLTNLAANVLPKFLSATVNALIDIFVLYFLLYFMLANAQSIERQAHKYLPFKRENNHLLLTELKKQTISNSIGIAVLAIIQTIIAWIGYMIFGVADPFFWAIITGIASSLPVVGTGIVWIPLCIFLYASGKEASTIGLVLYCAIVMAAVENIFRFMVIKKLGDVHPVITFFGVIMGVELFGFVGVIFGPLLISYFILLVRIYRNEYMDENHEVHHHN